MRLMEKVWMDGGVALISESIIDEVKTGKKKEFNVLVDLKIQFN